MQLSKKGGGDGDVTWKTVGKRQRNNSADDNGNEVRVMLERFACWPTDDVDTIILIVTGRGEVKFRRRRKTRTAAKYNCIEFCENENLGELQPS